jgi:NAD(P)-dependent dehydrogenase (short-subunit alcohol dehydrogenase family)
MTDTGGRIVAVTGAARGIGAAIVRAFLKSGAHVIALDRDAVSLDRSREKFAEVSASIDTILTDVGDEASVRNCFAMIGQTHGGLDVLVNNAGIAIRRQTIDLTLEEWEAVLKVNITGPFLCAKYAGPLLFERSGSSVINIASIMGMSGGGLYPNPSYQASKGALVNFTRALAVEWASRGVRVNAVAPTWVKTELTRALTEDKELMARIRAITPLGRVAEADEVAAAVLYLASKSAAMVTGHILSVDGGFLAQ